MKELCIKLVIETSLYYDARSEKQKKTISIVVPTGETVAFCGSS